jgi:hypothetical protein
MTPRRWEISHDFKPMPANEYRTLHWRKRADYDLVWRNAFGFLARRAKVPQLDAAIITVVQQCKHHSLPDVGACFQTAKAAIDGLVDARVLVDDDPAHLKFLGFVAPTRGPEDRFTLIVEEYIEEAIA